MYTEYFGFREKPFNLTPDPRFFYENPVYREAYANLLLAVRERKGLSVLTGEVGTGKTTLLLRLMEQVGSTVRFAFVYNTRLSFDELLRFMCEEFLIPVGGKSRVEKILALNEFLIDQRRGGSTAVLLIDEAQHLDDDALENLRLLSNLETATEKLLQIVLVGQPELLAKLDDPRLRQIRQRIAVWIRLSRLQEKEIGGFIHYRLRAVGYRGRELFPLRTVRLIVVVTQGIPRLINIVCDNALLIAYAGSKWKVSPEIIREVAKDLRLEPGLRFDPGEGRARDWTFREREDWTFEDRERAYGRWSGIGRSRSRVGRLAALGMETFLGVLVLAGLLFFISPLEIQALIPDMSVKAGGTVDAIREKFKSLQQTLQPQAASKGNLEMSSVSGPAPEAGARDRASEKPVKPVVDRSLQEEQPRRPDAEGNRRMAESTEPGNPAEETGRWKGDRGGVPPGEWIVHPIVLQRGASISELVRRYYGSDNTLAVDLAHEYNPRIRDLNRLRPGDEIWLPPLSREILIRRQSDGTYNLILASFRSSLAADRFADRVERRGYVTAIRPKKVFGERSLHRVQIVGLTSMSAADRAWEVALANRWLEWDGRLASKKSGK